MSSKLKKLKEIHQNLKDINHDGSLNEACVNLQHVIDHWSDPDESDLDDSGSNPHNPPPPPQP